MNKKSGWDGFQVFEKLEKIAAYIVGEKNKSGIMQCWKHGKLSFKPPYKIDKKEKFTR